MRPHLRFFLLLFAGAAGGPLAALALGQGRTVAFALVMSALCVLSAVALHFRPADWRVRAGAALSLALCTPSHYGATGQVIRHLAHPHLDERFKGFDEALLGWIFPRGEVAVWLDQNSWIGPSVFLGKLLTEIFQLVYFSYYFWGYLLAIYLLVRVCAQAAGKPEIRGAWQELQDFLCAWAGAYFINFLCYVAVPVIGPKFYSPQSFQHPVDGFGLARIIQEFIISQQAVMEDCFPSGHTALSWVTALTALKLAPRYGRVVLPFAVLITCATVYLRYHYVTDLVGAVPLVGLALVWGGFLPRRSAV